MGIQIAPRSPFTGDAVFVGVASGKGLAGTIRIITDQRAQRSNVVVDTHRLRTLSPVAIGFRAPTPMLTLNLPSWETHA